MIFSRRIDRQSLPVIPEYLRETSARVFPGAFPPLVAFHTCTTRMKIYCQHNLGFKKAGIITLYNVEDVPHEFPPCSKSLKLKSCV